MHLGRLGCANTETTSVELALSLYFLDLEELNLRWNRTSLLAAGCVRGWVFLLRIVLDSLLKFIVRTLGQLEVRRNLGFDMIDLDFLNKSPSQSVIRFLPSRLD